MLVREVMVKSVRTVKAADSVRSVAAIICTNKISGLPVVDDQNKLIGLISEKDILNTLLPSYHDFLEDPIGARDFVGMEKSYSAVLQKEVTSLMTKKLFTISPEDPVMKAASQMALHNFRRMPVVEKDGTLAGIVSLGDIHKAIFKRELGI
ncbi:MAG: CBS domain-containing protein [Magnetococcales bacterium]|nr:CBS domain-containing protein [Magnetococcales bacterium]